MKDYKSKKFLVLSVAFILAACNFGGGSSVNPDISSNEPDSSVTSSEDSSEIESASSEKESSSKESSSSKSSSSSSSTSEHTHTWDTNWSSDDEYHWHKCTGTIDNGNGGGWGWGGWGGTACEEIKDKAKHTFDAGVVTTAASAYSEGVKTYTCTVCKKTKTETIPATGGADEKVGDFTFNNDINVEQEIHTADQKNFLNYSKEYYNITSSELNSYNATGTAEKSFPNQVTVTWNYNAPSGKTVSKFQFVYGQKSDLSDGYVIDGTTAKSIKFYNPYLGDNYFKVLANLNDGSVEVSPIKIFKVASQAPRNLKIGTMSNCRDMGGRTTVAGGKVKQGVIYRTAEPGSSPSNEIKEVMLKQLKCKTEIYVKDGGTDGPSPLGSSVKYVNASMDYGATPYSNMSRNAERLRKVFSVLKDENNYPLFYHCRIGTDRTGICAVAINGLIGVPFNEIIQDYSFSNFGKIDGQRYAHKTPDNNGDDIAKYIDEVLAMPGKNFQEQMYNSLRSIGIPAADLIKVIDILTEGKKADLPTDGIIAKADDMTLGGGASKKTATDYKNPDAYVDLSSGKSASYEVEMAEAAEANIVAYIGCTNSSDSTKLASGISLKIDGTEQTICDKTYFKAGFGKTQQASRTGYMFNILGKYSLSAGKHTITITGKNSDVFNLGTIGVFGGAKGEAPSQPSGGESENPSGGETTACEHTFGTANAVVASGEGIGYETKDCSKCGAQRVALKALDGTISGSNKSGTPDGYLKLSANNEKVTVKFNYSAAKAGKIYLEGIMDSYPTNASKDYYSQNKGATNGNFTLTVNGTAVDFSAMKGVTFGTMLGSDADPNRSGYSKEGLCEVGEVAVKSGLNTLEFTRIDSYNLLVRNFVLIVK